MRSTRARDRDDFAVFRSAVWRLVRKIPRGRVATYGQLAAMLGRERGARLVGRAMRDCPGTIPWHRVVNASGGISARPRVASMMTQQIRLEQDGVVLRRGRVPLRRYRWTSNGRSEAPAETMNETRAPSELLGRRAPDRRRQDPRGRTPRFRFDLDGGGLRV